MGNRKLTRNPILLPEQEKMLGRFLGSKPTAKPHLELISSEFCSAIVDLSATLLKGANDLAPRIVRNASHGRRCCFGMRLEDLLYSRGNIFSPPAVKRL